MIQAVWTVLARLVPLILMTLGFLWAREAAAGGVACRAVHRLDTEALSTIESNGKRLVFEFFGSEDAATQVIFLNGIDKGLSQWTRVRESLQFKHPDWGFTHIDLLGQGKTAELNPTVGNSISYREQVDALNVLIRSRGLAGKKLILIGHSYGGGIAARLIKENPGLVKEAILVSPFVDHLETHQPGVGPVLWWAKQWSDMMGLRGLYEAQVQMGSDAGAMMTWPVYSYWHSTNARLSDVMALSRGIRDLQMDQSLRGAGPTRISILSAQMDELIPVSAHAALFAQVPTSARGRFALMTTTHESVTTAPDLVAREILRTLDAK